jgi:hypothetical protein
MRESRRRKARPKSQAAPATRAAKKRGPKKRAEKTSPAGHNVSPKNVSPKAGLRPKPVKSPPDQLDDFVEAAARVLALPIEPQWLAAIKANLDVNLRLGTFVAEFALPDETEPAPIFTA